MSKDQQALKELFDAANEAATEQSDEAGKGSEDTDTEEGTAGEDGGKEKPAASAKDKGEGEGEDPTAGMTPEQARDYWKRRAAKNYADFRKEKTRRQELQRGPLGTTLDTTRAAPAAGAPEAKGDAPKSLDDVENIGQLSQYILAEAKRQIKADLSEEQLDKRIASSEEAARKQYDGDDGLPEYDEVVDEYVLPLIKQNPKIYELIRLLPDPGQAAYTLGMMLKFPDFREQLKGQGREELTKNINAATKKAATVKGRAAGKQTSAKLTAADINAMNDEEFEKEIEKVRSGNV